MALLIDERVAGGRPQRLAPPPTLSAAVLTAAAADVLSRARVRALRTRLIVAWARL